jgi:hypothetical protein
MVSLNQESGFNSLVKHYEENKHRPWSEWLQVSKIFPRPGKQGLVGIMTSKIDAAKIYVFKISQHINYLVHHELGVMSSLNEMSDFCPHFCRSVGAITCEVDAEKKKDGNPFELKSKYTIEKEVLLTEFLAKTYKLRNYIYSDKISEDILYSTVKQILLGISISQRLKNFSHYDLHSNNIMMRKCDKDLVFLYIIDETNQFCVPTHGHYPIIIDYGFSYSKEMDGNPLWASMSHTDAGFTGDRHDPIVDQKLFLVTVSDEINHAKNTKKSKRLLNITKNVYSNLQIDWDSGWDIFNPKCAVDNVLDRISEYHKISKLFSELEYHCMDIIQTLIILPLEPQKHQNLEISYMGFLKEFSKIEKEIGSEFFCLYILKGIVDAARQVRHDYIRKDTREQAIGYFRQATLERIDSVSKFVTLKDLKYENMLCSLLCFARCAEGLMCEFMNNLRVKKDKQYSKIPLKSPEELFVAIDVSIKDPYRFTENTKVIAIDCTRKKCYPVRLSSKEIVKIDQFKSLAKGPELYKILQRKKSFEIQ